MSVSDCNFNQELSFFPTQIGFLHSLNSVQFFDLQKTAWIVSSMLWPPASSAFFWCDRVIWLSSCSLCWKASELYQTPIQPYGFVLIEPNLTLTLTLFLLLPWLLGFDIVVESSLAIRMAVLTAAEPLIVRLFNFHRQKVLCHSFSGFLEKLMLISFFWSSIKRVNSRRFLKLVCFSASIGAEIDGFKVSLNFSIHWSSKVAACYHNLNSLW